MMWIARLSWRSPPRCSRWRWVLPELAGIGAVPACRAKYASVGNRLAPAVWPMMIAAVTVPQPCWSSSCGAWASIRLLSSASSSRSSLAISLIRFRSRLRDPQLRAAGQPRELAGEPRADPWAFQRRRAELGFELAGRSDQMPAQPVDHAGCAR